MSRLEWILGGILAVLAIALAILLAFFWLRPEGSSDALLVQLEGVRERLPPGGRVVLEADGVSPAWLLARSTPTWRIALYLEGEPDVYVLEPR